MGKWKSFFGPQAWRSGFGYSEVVVSWRNIPITLNDHQSKREIAWLQHLLQ